MIEIDKMRIDPGAIGFTSGFSQEHKYSTVGEQITIAIDRIVHNYENI